MTDLTRASVDQKCFQSLIPDHFVMSLLWERGECALHIRCFGDVGSDSGLVHSVQHVFAVHGQRVRCGEHLLLALLLQRGDGVLLRQPHFADQLGHVVVQQLLGALDLQGEERRFTQVWLRAFSSIFCSHFM